MATRWHSQSQVMSQMDSRTSNDAAAACPVKSDYIFDNARPQTELRFSTVAEMFDPGTMRHLTELGVGIGWRCLEVGGGGGSIASWLCDRVGPTGEVTATDIDTPLLDRLSKGNLEVRRHHIVSDPLPGSDFAFV